MCHLKLPGCDPLNEVPLPKGCPSLPPIEDGIVTAAHRRAISTTSICKVDQEGNVISLRTCHVVTWPQLFLIGESHHLTARDIFLAGMFMEKLLSCRQRAWKGAERKRVDPLLKKTGARHGRRASGSLRGIMAHVGCRIGQITTNAVTVSLQSIEDGSGPAQDMARDGGHHGTGPAQIGRRQARRNGNSPRVLLQLAAIGATMQQSAPKGNHISSSWQPLALLHGSHWRYSAAAHW